MSRLIRVSDGNEHDKVLQEKVELGDQWDM